MAPPSEKNLIKSKCHLESRDGKQKLFSFRWLLRKSKSSRSAKEMAQAEKSFTVPSSKSCDTGLTAFESVERCPTFLLWKLLPPAGKSLGRSSNLCAMPEKLPFRTSFSCSDVYNMVPSLNTSNIAGSTRDLSPNPKNNNSQMKYPSYTWYRLHKSSAALNNVDTSLRPSTFFKPEEYIPNPCHYVLCKLCLTSVPASEMYTLHECKCAFCVLCLQQYLTINIKEGNVTITCPDAECNSNGKFLISEIKEIAGEDAYFMFERYKLNLDVELDPNRVWCPSAGCETICTFQPASNPEIGVSVICLKCRTRFCSVCKLNWHGTTTSCEDARRNFSDEIEFSISEDESSIKRCPNCRIPIEKDDGCAQMMCYRCKHVFCWHCLASLDDDFLLRHYDKGPCRNKLGHSRASMIWHRTQVVGIFAGFSFLLLMASPFLLLAAPCLLCCRCKNKYFYEEATPL